ncbi:hypothetical protein P167DRAFT_595241 [Morchella conica CCBAS932]|uniref:Secreted protein n=1 Tax=Morchella conica CCBAS932 TaxID=1392247 RepID=A0A3N4KE23_9PEZI|nr:hypothetical protein P167DRAFT_595241 [Morchella conica CCBAS932]
MAAAASSVFLCHPVWALTSTPLSSKALRCLISQVSLQTPAHSSGVHRIGPQHSHPLLYLSATAPIRHSTFPPPRPKDTDHSHLPPI